MNHLISELRRRSVFKVAAAYGVVTWLIIQAASITLPAFGAPVWAMRGVITVAMIGFPISVLLAWIYDITPQGIRRSNEEELQTLGSEEAAVEIAVQKGGEHRLALYIGAGLLAAAVSVGSISHFGLFTLGSESTLKSIAVLPFENLSGDPENDFFSAGIHEDVMTQLYKLGGMRVISRTSVMQYRGSGKSIRTVAEELGVGAILEASVRRDGDRIRIDARLIDAVTDGQIWAESYDRELRDVLVIQGEIAHQIAEALHARLSPAALTQLAATRSRTVDPQMYESYLRGLFEANEGRHPAAIGAFRAALRLDPAYAPAHAAIARSYYALGFFGELSPAEAFGAMREAASMALELDSDLADAHATMALYYLHYQWNWAAADRHFRKGLQLSPNHAQVRHDYAHFLLAVGRVGESVQESLRAVELDPGNSMLKACAGWHGFTDREYGTAVTQAMGALMMMPAAFWPELILGWAYEHQGRHNEAIASLRNAVTHSRGSPLAIGSLAHALGRAGERTPARQLLDELLARSDERYVSAYDIAVIHAGLGDSDQSLIWLRRAFAERSAMLVNVGWDPRFDGVRDHPRFVSIIRDLKLPDRPPPKPAAPSTREAAHRGM